MATSGKGIVNKFLGHVLPGVVRPMRVLWNEVIGFIFFVLAMWALPSAWRNIKQMDGNSDSLLKAGVSIGFALLMVYFAVTSFLRARKISRS